MFDPLPPWRRRARPAQIGVPRISLPGYTTPFPVAPRQPASPHDAVSAARLVLRLQALGRALDDLHGQARRFARWRAASRDGAGEGERRAGPRRFRRISPLKPGRPPGWRRKPLHEVHEVLDVTHGLAVWALEAPDTS